MRRSRVAHSLAALVVLAAVVLGACTGGDSSSSSSSGAVACPDDLPAACPSTPPSYTKDVAPIIQQSCTPCHAPGGKEANRLLTDYADLSRQRSAVLNQVHACRMPPSDGTPLTAPARVTLQAWLVCGAPNN